MLTLLPVKDVHKVPALDLVGWYTILPTSGPQPFHLPIHRQILHTYNESAILLGFHPAEVLEGKGGGKLPLTIYESNYEADDHTAAPAGGEDKEMKDGDATLSIKFKELPYSVETGEAEMISVDFVARGGGNATAVDSASKKKPAEKSTTKDKGKMKAIAEDESKSDENTMLSREDEELIASLTAKANAIKMLHARINLIATYLQNLPPSYVSNSVVGGAETDEKKHTPVNHSILRSIQALLGRLSLLIPADSASFEQELMSEKNDVNLVSLLSNITESIKDVREIGRKFAVVDAARGQKNKGNSSYSGVNSWNNSAVNSSGGGVLGVGDLIS